MGYLYLFYTLALASEYHGVMSAVTTITLATTEYDMLQIMKCQPQIIIFECHTGMLYLYNM